MSAIQCIGLSKKTPTWPGAMHQSSGGANIRASDIGWMSERLLPGDLFSDVDGPLLAELGLIVGSCHP